MNLVSSYIPSHSILFKLEALMLQEQQIELPLRHFFTDKIYSREITMPKGAFVTGKVHLHEHLNIISKGKVLVTTENGVELIEAPFTFISPANTKRLLLTLEDTVWTTIHNNPENITDLKLLEEKIVTNSCVLDVENKKWLG